MALIRCTECGGNISDKANACIHCGCPMNHYINTQGLTGRQKRIAEEENERIFNKRVDDYIENEILKRSWHYGNVKLF